MGIVWSWQAKGAQSAACPPWVSSPPCVRGHDAVEVRRLLEAIDLLLLDVPVADAVTDRQERHTHYFPSEMLPRRVRSRVGWVDMGKGRGEVEPTLSVGTQCRTLVSPSISIARISHMDSIVIWGIIIWGIL